MCITLREMTDLVNSQVTIERLRELEQHLRECKTCRNARHQAETREALDKIGAVSRSYVALFYEALR